MEVHELTGTRNPTSKKRNKLKYHVKPLDVELLRKKLMKAKIMNHVADMIFSANDDRSNSPSTSSEVFSVLENTVKRKLSSKVGKYQTDSDGTSRTIATWVEDILKEYARAFSPNGSQELSMNSLSGPLTSRSISKTRQVAEDVIIEKVNESMDVGSKGVVTLKSHDGRLIEVHATEVNGKEATLVRREVTGCEPTLDRKWSTWMIHVTNNPGEHLDPSAVNVLAHVTQSGHLASEIQLNKSINEANKSAVKTENVSPPRRSKLVIKASESKGRDESLRPVSGLSDSKGSFMTRTTAILSKNFIKAEKGKEGNKTS